MVRTLSKSQQNDIVCLLNRGLSFREISRELGYHRNTIKRCAEAAYLAGQSVPPDPKVATGKKSKKEPKPPRKSGHSACKEHREFIECELRKGRNAMSIFQDLVELFGFNNKYNSVKRFVRHLRRKEPEQFAVLDFFPGEEAQVDYGEGALTVCPKTGKLRKPRLFVMTLRYSRASFRKVVWKSSSETFARLCEEAFRSFGGVPQYLVLDNLKEGVLKPDIYEPQLNPVLSALLEYYGVVGDPARVRDPDRKGTVEKAVHHTQETALKGRQFKSVEEQNAFLMHWEETWARTRIHGRTKRRVSEMFSEERPLLGILPVIVFSFFKQLFRSVWDDGLIEVERSYYAVGRGYIRKNVIVRVYQTHLEVLDSETLATIRRHDKARSPGSFTRDENDRIYDPSQQTKYLLNEARNIGLHAETFANHIFNKDGRTGQRRMFGLMALRKKYTDNAINNACGKAIDKGSTSLELVKVLLNKNNAPPKKKTEFTQSHELIRELNTYDEFFNEHSKEE